MHRCFPDISLAYNEVGIPEVELAMGIFSGVAASMVMVSSFFIFRSSGPLSWT